MKKFMQIVKRYRVFLILLAAELVMTAFLPELGLASMKASGSNILQMLQILPAVFILLGLLDVWVDRATMMKYTGKGSGLRGFAISLLLGSCAAGPLYAAFPIAAMMLKKGSSVFNVMVFIGAWSATKIPPLTFEAASLGVRYMLTRLAMSLVALVLIALICDRALKEEEKQKLYALHQEEEA